MLIVYYGFRGGGGGGGGGYANFTLARRDSYLDYLHAGVKQDTVNTLRTSPEMILTVNLLRRQTTGRL